MSLLPLVLSAGPSSMPVVRRVLDREAGGADAGGSCRFCGARPLSAARRELFWVDAGFGSKRPKDEILACALCCLALDLARPQIDEEARLIWLPEFSQAALNILVRRIHLRFAEHGVFDPKRPGNWGAARFDAALAAYLALREREGAVLERIGASSARMLGEALGALSPEQHGRRAECLAGIRLLARGRFFWQGRDIYPELTGGL